ncbi:hypothetical protein B0H14DRAFT_542680 [Mycena olivaceomarginata]|nr:hypothetical protein B0H14DRAFT_542680 [Mycena olivaceomarginata]
MALTNVAGVPHLPYWQANLLGKSSGRRQCTSRLQACADAVTGRSEVSRGAARALQACAFSFLLSIGSSMFLRSRPRMSRLLLACAGCPAPAPTSPSLRATGLSWASRHMSASLCASRLKTSAARCCGVHTSAEGVEIHVCCQLGAAGHGARGRRTGEESPSWRYCHRISFALRDEDGKWTGWMRRSRRLIRP